MPVHLGKVAFDVGEDVFVIFHDMAVCVDDEFCHGSSECVGSVARNRFLPAVEMTD
jgi:hypothetical protein